MAKSSTTSIAVAGTGALVSGVGKLVKGKLGALILGFGMAHIVLGMLDMARPVVRKNS